MFFYSGTLAVRTAGCHVRINLLSSWCWMERGQLGSLLKAFPRWLSSLSFPTQDAQTPGGGRNNFSSTRVIRGAAAREMNFGTDVSRKVRSSAHMRNEEAAAGEAAGRRGNIWKRWGLQPKWDSVTPRAFWAGSTAELCLG